MAVYSKRTRKQEALIAALLSEPNQKAAAAAAGVGEKTLYRWLKLPEFQAAYREARRAVLDRAVASMQAGSEKAAATIAAVVETGEKDADRVRAAKVMLEYAFKGLTQAGVLHGEPPAADGGSMDAADVVQILAVRLRQIDSALLPSAEKAKLIIALAGGLLHALESLREGSREAANVTQVNTVDGMLSREEEEARRQALVRDPEYAELASAMLQRELDLSKKPKPDAVIEPKPNGQVPGPDSRS
jgi:hypothetical protein